MWLRRQWIIGLIGLVMMGVVFGEQGKATAEGNATDASTKPPLTGNPQIDYIHDPNLPHELGGYDLSDYPFFSRLPKDLLDPKFNFTCDDRLDGFYASVPHKCQVYHNCLFGIRYDFLCANYTVFDQKNFICHYVSEVDCKNSERHYDRNEELYVTTTTTTPKPQIIYIERPPQRRPEGKRPRRPPGSLTGGLRRPGNRRTTTTPAPVYYDDYYYDEYYDQYYDDYYNDYTTEKTTTTTTTTTQRPRRPNRPQRTRGGGDVRPRRPGGNVFNVRDRKRPRINPPVPVGDETAAERPRASRLQQNSPSRQQAVDDARVDTPPQNTDQDAPSESRRRRPGRKPRPGVRPPKKTTTTTTTTTEAVPEEDYYDYYDYAEEPSTTTAAPARPSRPSLSRSRPGSGSRGPQNRPDRTTTTASTTTTAEAPTTEASRGRFTRPSRVNVRKNPVNSRRTPVEGAVPLEDPQEAAPPQETGSQRQRPHRPQFPRKRPQNEPGDGTQETATVEEVPPHAPGLEDAPIDTATDSEVSGPVEETSVRSRAPLRRLDQGGPGRQRSGPRARGQRRQPTPDYYDY